MNSGSFVERELQLTVSYASWPPCTNIPILTGELCSDLCVQQWSGLTFAKFSKVGFTVMCTSKTSSRLTFENGCPVRKLQSGGAAYLTSKLRVGDVVTAINATPLQTLGPRADISSLILGDPFSRVSVTISAAHGGMQTGAGMRGGGDRVVHIVRTVVLLGEYLMKFKAYENHLDHAILIPTPPPRESPQMVGHTYTHTHTHAHTHMHSLSHTHTRSNSRAHAHKHTHTHLRITPTPTHTHQLVKKPKRPPMTRLHTICVFPAHVLSLRCFLSLSRVRARAHTHTHTQLQSLSQS